MNPWSENQANETRQIAAVLDLAKPMRCALVFLVIIVFVSLDGNTRPAVSQARLSAQFTTQMRSCIHNAIAKAFPVHEFNWKREAYFDYALISCANIPSPYTAGDEAEFLLGTLAQEYQNVSGCWATQKTPNC